VWIEVLDLSEHVVLLNTDNITYVREYKDYDYLVVYLVNHDELRLDRNELRKLKAALRRIGLEGSPR
jgi:hypothetical protein